MTAPPQTCPSGPLLPLRTGNADVVEADFIMLGEVPSGPVPFREKPGDERVFPVSSMETFRPQREPLRLFGARGGAAFWLFGLLLAASSFWVSGGHALLKTGHAPAGLQRQDGRKGLSLSVQQAGVETAGGREVLRIAAEAENRDVQTHAVPPVWITVTTGKGTTLRYAVAASLGAIAAGGRQSFESTLPIPAEGIDSIGVAFADGNG